MKYNPKIVSAYFRDCGLPAPVLEHRFHHERKWRFDFCWPNFRVALEVEGGIWTGGRHNRGAGFKKDCEKYNCAASMGWRILRVEPSELCMESTAKLIHQTLTV